MPPIYLDNNAATRPHPAVLDAMRPFLAERFANPSSVHMMGQDARYAVERARQQVAGLIGADPSEIVFTSGGTESNNLAILGTLAGRPAKRRVVTTAVEHASVRDPCRRLAEQGDGRVTFVGVDRLGRLDLDSFGAALDVETAVASVMHANNETGVVFPIDRVAEIAARHGVPLHVDAVQTAGRLPIDVKSISAAMMTLSSHKIYGPKGVGALYVRRGHRLRCLQLGGHQEFDHRPGTENVPGIVGFGVAAELAARRSPGRAAHVAMLRDQLERGILDGVDSALVNGDRDRRIGNTTNIAFAGLDAEALLIALSAAGVCAAAGAACSSGSLEPSHVLEAMGLESAVVRGSIRFSLSDETTETEIDEAIRVIVGVVRRLAAMETP